MRACIYFRSCPIALLDVIAGESCGGLKSRSIGSVGVGGFDKSLGVEDHIVVAASVEYAAARARK